jgi:hypothetical protein
MTTSTSIQAINLMDARKFSSRYSRNEQQTTTMATPTLNGRKQNWTQEELNILVSMVTDRWSIIKRKFKSGLAIQKKMPTGNCR